MPRLLQLNPFINYAISTVQTLASQMQLNPFNAVRNLFITTKQQYTLKCRVQFPIHI